MFPFWVDLSSGLLEQAAVFATALLAWLLPMLLPRSGS